ncbi:MAG: cytidine deaminase [Halobacteriales archaeon]
MDELIERAREAAERAYVPYSEYAVGAALGTADGAVYAGCNVENANYSNSIHAEEMALGEAVRDGHRAFRRLAVVSAAEDGPTPCGACRQTLREFCDADLAVVCPGPEGVREYRLGDLLPAAMSGETLADARADRE